MQIQLYIQHLNHSIIMTQNSMHGTVIYSRFVFFKIVKLYILYYCVKHELVCGYVCMHITQ